MEKSTIKFSKFNLNDKVPLVRYRMKQMAIGLKNITFGSWRQHLDSIRGKKCRLTFCSEHLRCGSSDEAFTTSSKLLSTFHLFYTPAGADANTK